MKRRAGRAERGEDGFLAHRALIAAACGIAMAEAGLLITFAPAARTLAPQVTALPPLAIFHDLRWLYSAQRSWLAFGILLGGLIVARSLVNTVLVRLAWPAGQEAPSAAASLGWALAVTAFACVVMSPLVSLTFGVAIVPFSWPFLALLPAMLLISLPLSHAGLASGWWRTLPPPAAVGWLLTEFAMLSAAAAVTGAVPVWLAVPVAGLAGLLNARAWYGVTGAVARPHPVRPATAAAGPPPYPLSWLSLLALPLLPEQPLPAARPRAARHRRHTIPQWLPVAPLALALVITLVIGMTRVVFVLGSTRQAPMMLGGTAALPAADGTTTGGQHTAKLPGTGRSHPVLEVAGFGSSCCSTDRSLAKTLRGAFVQQFSYLGMNRAGQPLPYAASASNLPLPLLGDRIAAQVWRLHRHTGLPVDVVAESEGTLGVDAMLAQHPDAPVGSIALLSPIVAPGQSRYRLTGGSGQVTGDELHAMIWFVGGLSPFGSTGAEKFIDSVNNVGARFATVAARNWPLRVLQLVPLADAVTLPACQLPPNVLVVPAFHGRLLGDPLALRMVRAFLSHQPVRAAAALRTTAEIMAAAASAWRMPEPTAPNPPCKR
jgi:hypothetical protein